MSVIYGYQAIGTAYRMEETTTRQGDEDQCQTDAEMLQAGKKRGSIML
jgi:hypothetical protein